MRLYGALPFYIPAVPASGGIMVMLGDNDPDCSPECAHRYLIALGSNQPHPRYGRPRQVIASAMAQLSSRDDLALLQASRIISSAPQGPSKRRYANAAALIATDLPPERLLAQLQQQEHDFGRRRRGQKWQSRTLDLDIILWSGGQWHSKTLTIPHPHYRIRDFVLGPLCQLVPKWRDPYSHLQLRHLRARLNRKKAHQGLDRCANGD